MSTLNVGTITLSTGLTLPAYNSSPDNRPAHSAGRTIFDNTTGTIQVSDGSQWISAGTSGSGLISATGGEITFSGGYKVHTFSQVGQFDFSVDGAASGATAEVLVVAGGGAGGTIGGGGGGGGVCYHSAYPISTGSYAVEVGAGAICPLAGYPSPKGVQAGPSIFGTHEAYGGGPGGSWSGQSNEQGTPGGSGGGGTGPGPDAQGGSATKGVAPGGGQTYGNPGYNGGNLTSGTHSGTHTGGGGGGANPNNSRNGRVGGDGITLMGLTVGGGGGGGTHENYANAPIATPQAPGGGGRGAGRSSQFAGGGGLGFGEPALTNTGGGGGGGWYNGGGTGQGGAGAPGIVVVRHSV